MKHNDPKSALILVFSALIWGVAFVAQSVGMRHLGPFSFGAARFLLGGIVLVSCIYLVRVLTGSKGIAIGSAEFQTLLKAGILCGMALYGASSFQQVGLLYTTVGKAGFITTLYIVLVPILRIAQRKTPGLGVWLGVALAAMGLYFLCINEEFSMGMGDLLILCSAILFSLQILLVDYFSPRVDALYLACVEFFVCGWMTAITMLFTERIPPLVDIKSAWVPIAYAGILSGAVAYTLQIFAQKKLDPVLASLLMSLESVFSVLAGWVLLDEVLSLRELMGCGLVFLAILLAQLPSGSFCFKKKSP